jgi:hypothetical protein
MAILVSAAKCICVWLNQPKFDHLSLPSVHHFPRTFHLNACITPMSQQLEQLKHYFDKLTYANLQ